MTKRNKKVIKEARIKEIFINLVKGLFKDHSNEGKGRPT